MVTHTRSGLLGSTAMQLMKRGVGEVRNALLHVAPVQLTFTMRPRLVPTRIVLASIWRMADGLVGGEPKGEGRPQPRAGPRDHQRSSPDGHRRPGDLDGRIEERRHAGRREVRPRVALVDGALERYAVEGVIHDVRVELIDAAIPSVTVGDVIPHRGAREANRAVVLGPRHQPLPCRGVTGEVFELRDAQTSVQRFPGPAPVGRPVDSAVVPRMDDLRVARRKGQAMLVRMASVDGPIDAGAEV